MSRPRFNDEIASYDAHIYYNAGFGPSRAEAVKLRETIKSHFASDIEAGLLRVYDMVDRPIGPHPTAMFECDFSTQTMFSRLVPWLQLHRGKLSVLVHPHTGDEVKDHTDHAVWLGDRMPLIIDLLQMLENNK